MTQKLHVAAVWIVYFLHRDTSEGKADESMQLVNL